MVNIAKQIKKTGKKDKNIINCDNFFQRLKESSKLIHKKFTI